MKRLAIAVIAIFLLGALAMLGLRWRVHALYSRRISSTVAAAPVDGEPRVAIVFGAGLWENSRPSPVLYDRIATAVELYRAGKVSKLLLSGDNRFESHNEPAAMRETARALGVPDEDLAPDYAGRRTYDTCYRAREIFGVRRAVLVTQSFHLDRAMYLCNSLGIESIGVAADRQPYGAGERLGWAMREIPALTASWLDLHVLHPVPVLGQKIPLQSLP